MPFADVLSLLTSGQSTPAGAVLHGGSLSTALEAIQLVRELATVANVPEPFDSPDGLRKRLDIVLSFSAKAAKLTETTTDDAWVDAIRRELAPELTDAVAYLMRRFKVAPIGAASPV
jgi:hypothetical protein